MANSFQQFVSPSQAADWRNTEVVKPAADYSGVFDAASQLQNSVFEGMAVEDVLGDGSFPLTSVGTSFDGGNIQQQRNVLDVNELSGLKSIRAARQQGAISGSRAQSLATRKLQSALAQYPQHREAILKAYDDIVDPLGSRGASIFDNTAQEELMVEQAKRQQELDDYALKQGFTDFESFSAFKQKVQIEAEAQAKEDKLLADQKNVMAANGRTLTTNVFRGISSVNTEVASFILEQTQNTGGIDSNTMTYLMDSLTLAESQYKAKLSRFKANPQFDYDKAVEEVESNFASMRGIIESKDNVKKLTSLLSEMKTVAESSAWQDSPNLANILNLGGNAGSDILNALGRASGDTTTVDNIQKQLSNIVNNPALIKQMSMIMKDSGKVADIDPKERQQFLTILNSAKQVFTDKEDYDQVMATISEGTVQTTNEMISGATDIPTVDEVAVPSVAAMVDPKNREYYQRPESQEKARQEWSNSLNIALKQVARDAENSEWYVASDGSIRGRTNIGQRRDGSPIMREHAATMELLNRVIVPATKMHTFLLGGDNTTDTFKQKLVEALNSRATPEDFVQYMNERIDESSLIQMDSPEEMQRQVDEQNARPQVKPAIALPYGEDAPAAVELPFNEYEGKGSISPRMQKAWGISDADLPEAESLRAEIIDLQRAQDDLEMYVGKDDERYVNNAANLERARARYGALLGLEPKVDSVSGAGISPKIQADKLMELGKQADAATKASTMTNIINSYEFTKEQEGRYGEVKSIHHPSDSSGVTIGYGYDMKERTKAQVKQDLIDAGVSPDVAEQLSLGAGLSGANAKAFTRDRRNRRLGLTEEQVDALFQKIIPEYEARMESQYNRLLNKANFKAKLKAGEALPPIQSLPQEIKNILFDYAYNGGVTTFPNFFYALLSGDKSTALAEYKRYSGGQPLGKRNVDMKALLESLPYKNYLI